MRAEAGDSWRQPLRQRFGAHWLLKLSGIFVSVSAFMAFYLWLQQHPQFPVTMMPALAPDRLVPFTPWSFVPYVSLWLYIGTLPALLDLRAELPRYLAAVVATAVIGCGIFVLWPTAAPEPDIDWAHWPFIAWLKAADHGGNACPSLHVAYAVLTMLWLNRLLGHINAPRWLRALNLGWCLAILWSTLALRQHVALDVLGGLTLALAVQTVTGWPPAWQSRADAGAAEAKMTHPEIWRP